jgi:hypothetical protein
MKRFPTPALESKKEVLTEKFTKQRSEELCAMYLSHSIVGTGAFVKGCDGLDSLLRLERQTKSIRILVWKRHT